MRPLYSALSGSHAYGFPSATSDLDIREIHVMPVESMFEVVGTNASLTKPPLGSMQGTLDVGLTHVDTVSYEVGRFMHLLMGGNAGMYEILMSPIVFHEDEWITTIRRMANHTACKRHVKHHMGLAQSEWMYAVSYDLADTSGGAEYSLKKILYAFRSLLAAVAIIESDAYALDIQSLSANAVDAGVCDASMIGYLDELIALRQSHQEKALISESVFKEHGIDERFEALDAAVKSFFESSGGWLPDYPSGGVQRELKHILRELRKDVARDELGMT